MGRDRERGKGKTSGNIEIERPITLQMNLGRAAAGVIQRAAQLRPFRPAPAPWDVLKHFSPAAVAKLSEADKANIRRSVRELQRYVERNTLSHIPVFGFLSLRNSNFRELGKASQAEVRQGVDVVDATLKDHALDIIGSTVLRGTPERPGVTAGLRREKGAVTPGVVVLIPAEGDPERRLAVLLEREIEAESDHLDARGTLGRRRTSASYEMPLLTVTTADGSKTRAWVFRTNPHGPKALTDRGYFGEEGLTEGNLAWLMSARGGYTRPQNAGPPGGGPCVEYWDGAYFATQAARGEPVLPLLQAARERARHVPSDEVIRDICERAPTDPAAREELDALLETVNGAASPVALRNTQLPSETLGLNRTPRGARPEPSRADRLQAGAQYAAKREGR